MLEFPTPLREAKTRANSHTTKQDIGEAIIAGWTRSRNSRDSVEPAWDEVYGMYRASVSDMSELKRRSFYTAGNQRDWKHRVNGGKTFDVVETLVAYLKGATFPSDDWFDLKGSVPELADAARVVKQLTKLKLEQCAVRDTVDEWLRTLVMFGVATYRVGWDERTERTHKRMFQDDGSYTDIAINESVSNLNLECLSPYDVWLDTGAKLNRGGTYVRLRLTREELAARCADGYYTLDQDFIDRYEDYRFGDPETDKSSAAGYSSQQSEVIEYYGGLLLNGVQYWCVHAVFFGKQLIRLTDSDYWCGSPFVTSTMLPNRDSIYGMSVLHPNLGALHILNVLTNSRLDNIAVNIDKMWTLVEDGILKREDVKTRPGAVFKVAQHGSLQPVNLGSTDFVVTYQEAAVQEANIDRNTSTGPLIGNAQPRSGERVTAAEIQGVRDAGGNRLASLHAHIEDSGTLLMLNTVFKVLQQYYVTPEVVRMYVPESDQDGFFSVDPEYLHYPYRFTALGAAYVVERQRNINDILQLLDISGRVPPIGEKLDYGKLLEDLLRQMRFDNPLRYIAQASPEAVPSAQTPPLEESMGGAPMEQGIQQQLMVNGGADMLQQVGVDTTAIPPEQLQALTQGLQP